MIWIEDFVSRIQMQGTPAQVKWAESLRQRRVAKLLHFRRSDYGRMLVVKLDQETMKAIGCVHPNHALQFLYMVVAAALSDPNAKAWIAAKDTPLETVLLECCDLVIARLIANPLPPLDNPQRKDPSP